jgi:hypothetical protein
MGFHARVILIFGREGVSGGKVPRQYRALRAPQGLKVRFGDLLGEVVRREGFSSDHDIHMITLLNQFNRIPCGKRGKGER